MFHAQFHSHYWQKSIHANVYINPTLFTPWRLLLSLLFLLLGDCCCPIVCINFFSTFIISWLQNGVKTGSWTIGKFSNTITSSKVFFFSYLRVTKRYLSQDTTSQQPQNTCFHFLLWSTWVENMCFGLLRSCVLRQIPFCVPRVRKMSPWRMWWCWGFCNCWWSCLYPIPKLGNDEGGEEIDT